MNQTNYNITNSSLVGSQIGTQNSQLYFNQSDFSSEINQAISEIKTITELSEKSMNSIIDLLQQIDIAVKSDNKEAQTEAKFTLKGMLKGIGNTGVKVISVLSGLANLAKFLVSQYHEYYHIDKFYIAERFSFNESPRLFLFLEVILPIENKPTLRAD